MADSTQDQSKLVKTVVASVLSYHTWDIDAILSHRHPKCWQQVYPTSLQRPRLNNEEYRQYFNSIMPLFKDFTLTISDIIEDAPKHKVALHVSSTAETVIGRYANEYVCIIKATEDDEKIIEFVEFVDSAFSTDFYQRLRTYLESQKHE